MSPRAAVARKQRSVSGALQRPVKIVVTGPFAAGKTTLIETVSQVAVVGTERDVTDGAKAVKSRTTVAMDFGRISFPGELSLFLFGTPGQRRFEMMWEILSEGMLGFILLVHAAEPRSVEEAVHILSTFGRYADVPYVVGVSHLDRTDRPADEVLAQVRGGLSLPDDVEVLGCDPRSREDVKALLLQVLSGVLKRLDRASTRAV